MPEISAAETLIVKRPRITTAEQTLTSSGVKFIESFDKPFPIPEKWLRLTKDVEANQPTHVKNRISSPHTGPNPSKVDVAPRDKRVYEEIAAPGNPRYKIEAGKAIGQGGMSRVFLGYDTKMDRKIAVKVVTFEPDEKEYADFGEIEAITVSKLNELNVPGIVKIYGFQKTVFPWEITGLDRTLTLPTIIMEYLDPKDSPTLASKLAHGTLTPTEVINTLPLLANTIDILDRNGIRHKDLKPGNIFFGNPPKIGDFGVSSPITKDQGRIGTPRYIAPEVASNNPTTLRSEEYSLATIAFEMLTHKTPRPIENPDESDSLVLLAAVAKNDLRELETSPLKPEVRTVLRKALATNPKNRYATCTQFVQALTKALISSKQEQIMVEIPPEKDTSTLPPANRAKDRTHLTPGSPTMLNQAQISTIVHQVS